MFNLFAFKGAQDAKMIQNQQYTSPEIITIPFNKSLSLRYGDLIKIKGFIVKKDNINKLMNEELEFTMGSAYFKIPFSFLIKSDKNGLIYFTKNGETNCFIDFSHDYFFNHKIPIIQLQFSDISVRLTNKECDYNVKIVVDKYILDNEERKQLSSTVHPIKHNIRNIKHLKIPLNDQNENKYTYKLETQIDFISQGIFIVRNCKPFSQINITLNDNLIAFNYDVNLLNIYDDDVGMLTYYGFNIDEKYNSNNIVGCINMSLFDKVTIYITLKSLNDECEPYLDIFMPYWNILIYNQGLVGIQYSI
jgi:hypothetical protein